jgi:type VI secretion system protein ImpF
MARRGQTPQFNHSLWDRLTDPSLIHGENVGLTESGQIEQIKQEVRRDLEWLLNSRRLNFEIPPEMQALERSIIRYGLPDLGSLDLANPREREQFRAVLAAVIRDFEPRLDQIEVQLRDAAPQGGRPQVHYRIEAVLKLDPTPLAVAFDTVLELGTKSFRVES